MSWDINRVILIGRLSNDPELKYIPSGTAVVKFGLAVGGKPKPDGGNSVSFFNVVAWGKMGENLAAYKHKGGMIAVDGRLEQRSWTTQDGTKRSTVEIIAERIEFIGTDKKVEPTKQQAAQNAPTNDETFDDSFYDNTNFDPTPVDPNF